MRRKSISYPSETPPTKRWENSAYPYEEWREDMYLDAVREAEEEWRQAHCKESEE